MNVTVGNQIRASGVDRRIIPSQIFLSQTLWIRKFTGTRKILKIVRKDKKIDKTSKNSTDESESQEIYTYMVRMSNNAEISRKYCGESSQLTN